MRNKNFYPELNRRTKSKILLIIFPIVLIFVGLLFQLFSYNYAKAGDGSKIHWVSPDGTAVWSNCESATDPGTNYCSLATANTNASAGDTVYFKGGTYPFSTYLGFAFYPTHSGTSDSWLIFKNAPGETPEIKGTYGTRMWGLLIQNVSYIQVDGLIFSDFTDYLIRAGAHHIEVKNCTFRNVTSPYRGGGFQMAEACVGGSEYYCYVSDIWVHHNTFYKLAGGGGCSGGVIPEGGDAVRVGYPTNTCSPVEHGTSATLATIEIGSKTFTTQAELPLLIGDRIIMRYDASHLMNGEITDYTGTSLTISVKWIVGSGTYDTWSIRECTAGKNSNITIEDNYMAYAGHAVMDNYGQYGVIKNNVAHNEPWYPEDNGSCGAAYKPTYYENPAYTGLYSHRIWQITDSFSSAYRYNLIEGNRLGHTGVNPNNDGSTALSFASPGNIVRYNFLYDSMHNNFKYKYGASYGWQASGGINNRVYNNTMYHNGYGYTYFQTCTNSQNGTCPKPMYNLRYYAPADEPGNVAVNNIVYGGFGTVVKGNPDIQPNSSGSIARNNFCTRADAACSAYGDPLFMNPDLTQTTSRTLPDLTLQSNSPARNGGTFLTQASDSASNSTTLVVQDAHYFQDGTWGASMARGVTLFPDWIAIGTVGNAAQISSIDYSTNTITFSSPITWSDGAPVWLYKKSDGTQVLYGSAPDYGAYEVVSVAPPPDTTPPAPPSGVAIS